MSKPNKNHSSLRVMLSMVAILCMSMLAMAEAPTFKQFYPGESTPPAVVKTNTKIYVYFTSAVQSCTYEVYQNNTLLGSATGTAGTTGGSTCTCEMWKEAFSKNIGAGDFDFVVTSYTYKSGSENVTYNYTSDKPKVTYHFNGQPAVIVQENKLPGNKLLSYYPDNSTDGIMSLVFSKPIAEGYKVELEYGNPDQSINHASMEVKSTLKDNVISIDFRGVLRSVDAMVPNHHFTDDSGNEIDPPTTIGLNLSNLKSTDGEDAMPVTIDPTGKERILSGRVNYVLNYEDISFPTPVIKAVEFYNSNTPNDKVPGMSATTDMMAITIADAKYIASADVKIEVGGKSYVINDYKVGNGSWTLTLPTEVRQAGSADMVVSIINASYTQVDGNNHIIAPYSFSNEPVITGQMSLAEVTALAPGSPVELIAAGIKVTMVNEDHEYIFIEDETAAVQVVTEDHLIPVAQGTALTGKLVGKYNGYGMLMIDFAKSNYQATPAEVTPTVITIADAMVESNYNRLVEFNADNGSSFEVEDSYIMIDDAIPAILNMLDENYKAPAKVYSVVGILYFEPNTNSCMVIVRNSDDITAGNTQAIESIVSQGQSVNDIYTVNGVKVRTAGESVNGLQPGIYVSGAHKFIVK